MKFGVHERVPVCHIKVGSVGIVVPVCYTVSNHETFKVWFEDIIVLFIGLVVLINLVGEIWDVYSSV